MRVQNKTETFDSFEVDSDREFTAGDDRLLLNAVVRLNAAVLGIVFGIVAALLIFIVTNWLVFKGGPVIGPHLALLGHFFYGYSVTFAGSFIGAFYAGLGGFAAGYLIGWIYNAVVFMRIRKK